MRGRVIVGCVVLGAASLLLPSQPSYDPWAWIVWGRELDLLHLDTTGGPSWKPLPVLFTALFAPTGAVDHALPPALWLIVARTGALMSLALAFSVARRLCGGDGRMPVIGGGVAALAVALSPQWLRYAAHGNEVPLAIALLLWSVDRALDGEHRTALGLGFAACLLRPEALPFVAIHALWSLRRGEVSRGLVAGLGAALVAAWVVPEWIGSGHPLDAGQQARAQLPTSLSRRTDPWLALLGRAHDATGPVLELGTAVAAVWAFWARRPVVLIGAGAAVGWVALVAAMTQAGFSGSERYLTPAVALTCVLTGVAVGGVGEVSLRYGLRGVAVPALAAVAVFALWLPARVDGLAGQARAASTLASEQAGFGDSVTHVGVAAIVTRGAPHVPRQFQTRAAWETRLTLGEVERAEGPGVRFRRLDAAGLGCGEPLRADGWCVAGLQHPPRGHEPLADRGG